MSTIEHKCKLTFSIQQGTILFYYALLLTNFDSISKHTCSKVVKMDLGSKITELRKQKGWSQNELAKNIEVSREIVGRYERNDAAPSIDIANRMADAFGVSLDYLVGNSDQEMDKATLNRIQEVTKLSPKEKELVFEFLDAFITKAKLKTLML